MQRIWKVWEREFSLPIDGEVWDEGWENAKSISVCNRTQALQLKKIIHPLHISSNRRHAF